MKQQLSRALARALILSFAATAQAVPIHFNFTGINTGSADMPAGSVQGQAITGGFTFETDRLVRQELVPAEFGVYFQGVPLANLYFGDRIVLFPEFGPSSSHDGYILFYDGCRTLDCQSDQDAFRLNAFSAEISPDIIASGFTGTYRTVNFSFTSGKGFVPPLDLFDATTIDPTAIVDLPISGAAGGTYAEFFYSCVAGECSNLSARAFSFEMTSVTRFVEAQAVPEPGTLGLMSLGLVGMLLVRRRPRVHRAG
jgi:hypothetical protein